MRTTPLLATLLLLTLTGCRAAATDGGSARRPPDPAASEPPAGPGRSEAARRSEVVDERRVERYHAADAALQAARGGLGAWSRDQLEHSDSEVTRARARAIGSSPLDQQRFDRALGDERESRAAFVAAVAQQPPPSAQDLPALRLRARQGALELDRSVARLRSATPAGR